MLSIESVTVFPSVIGLALLLGSAPELPPHTQIDQFILFTH